VAPQQDVGGGAALRIVLELISKADDAHFEDRGDQLGDACRACAQVGRRAARNGCGRPPRHHQPCVLFMEHLSLSRRSNVFARPASGTASRPSTPPRLCNGLALVAGTRHTHSLTTPPPSRDGQGPPAGESGQGGTPDAEKASPTPLTLQAPATAIRSDTRRFGLDWREL